MKLPLFCGLVLPNRVTEGLAAYVWGFCRRVHRLLWWWKISKACEWKRTKYTVRVSVALCSLRVVLWCVTWSKIVGSSWTRKAHCRGEYYKGVVVRGFSKSVIVYSCAIVSINDVKRRLLVGYMYSCAHVLSNYDKQDCNYKRMAWPLYNGSNP